MRHTACVQRKMKPEITAVSAEARVHGYFEGILMTLQPVEECPDVLTTCKIAVKPTFVTAAASQNWN